MMCLTGGDRREAQCLLIQDRQLITRELEVVLLNSGLKINDHIQPVKKKSYLTKREKQRQKFP